jgi:hypothetical protein
MGGEDIPFFLQEVPGCYFFLGSANPDRDLAYPHHHPRFDFDEAVLEIGAEMFARRVQGTISRSLYAMMLLKRMNGVLPEKTNGKIDFPSPR